MYEYNFKIKMAAKYRCIKIDLRLILVVHYLVLKNQHDYIIFLHFERNAVSMHSDFLHS